MLKCSIIYLFLFTAGVVLFAQQPEEKRSPVRIWEEPVTMPTYLVDEPDRIPRFYEGRAYQGAQGRVYPYPIYESLSDTRIEKSYDMIFIENEYIKVDLLPEIGGRLFGALDKTNQHDFIYRQHVIKPALIGMLGAWISGGIEWNFPHHHRATAFMPVDYVLVENNDGSCTAWIAELEIRHRMKFMLGVTLYPGRSYFEVTFKPYNQTPFIHSFLYFANTGVHTSEDYQVIFPPSTQFGTYHGKNQFVRWPISHEEFNSVDYSEGVDISWWKNHPEWTSIFCWNYEDDFVGGYDHGKEAGILLFSNHHIAPGKKFWTWSTGPRGQMWDVALTETDGPELELMIGGYSDNQPDYSWIQPYETKYLSQYFYPVREIGGVKNANLDAALNLERTGKNRVRIGFNTTSQRSGAQVLLKGPDKILFSEQIDIDPAHPYTREIKIPADIKDTGLRLSLLSSDGEELISYTPVELIPEEFPEVARPPAPPEDIETVEELYQTGLRLEQFYNPSFDPMPYYQEALERDPGNYRVNTALGIMYLKKGMFAEAEQHLLKAVGRITRNYTKPRDGEAYYYLGLCQRYLGMDRSAYNNFYQATWSQAFHTAAYYQLAELACHWGEYDEALEHLDRSLSTNALHIMAGNLKAVILRNRGQFKEALQITSRIREMDPLDFWSVCETYLNYRDAGEPGKAGEALKYLKAMMRDYDQSYLELSLNYASPGFFREAEHVLQDIYLEGKERGNINPMIYYYLGHFSLNNGNAEKAAGFYDKAGLQSTDYCFPFRLESIRVLTEAMNLNPEDPAAALYLGNLLFDWQPEQALDAWKKSAELDPSLWLTQRNLGMAFYKVNNDSRSSIQHYLKAIDLKPGDQRLLYELDLIMAAAREDPERRLQLLQEHHDAITNNNVCDALSREIMILVQMKRYEEALRILEENHFKQWEGISKAYNSFVDAHLFVGWNLLREGNNEAALNQMRKADEFPENMMVARPYRGGRSVQVYYFTGLVYEALGRDDLAGEQFRLSVKERQRSGLNENYFYKALSMKKLGDTNGADEIFDGLIKLGNDRLKSEDADFFAKFGEQETRDDKLSNAYYLIGLGYLGKGKIPEAKNNFSEAARLNLNHVWANWYLSEIQKGNLL